MLITSCWARIDCIEQSSQARGCTASVLLRRYNTPLVADIHFQPRVAMLVADAFEKIRVNPGNFADGRKTFEEINYDDPAEFEAEKEHIREVWPWIASSALPLALCLSHTLPLQNVQILHRNELQCCSFLQACLADLSWLPPNYTELLGNEHSLSRAVLRS